LSHTFEVGRKTWDGFECERVISHPDCTQTLIIHTMVSVRAGGLERYKTELIYHPGAHTELAKLPVMSQWHTEVY